MNQSPGHAFLAAVSAAILMGTLGFFVKESACSAQGCTFARFSIGLLLLFLLNARHFLRGEDIQFSATSAISGVGIAFCILFYFITIQETTISFAALMVYTGPIFAAVGEALINRQCPKAREMELISLAALGIIIVSFFAETGMSSGSPMGMVYGLLSGVSYSVYLIFNHRIPGSVSLRRRTLWQLITSTLVLIIPLLCTNAPFAGIPENSLNNFLSALAQGQWSQAIHSTGGLPFLLCIGLLQGYGAMVLVACAMKRLSATQYGAIAYLEPVIAVAMSWIVYHESITPWQWVGFTLVLAASLAQALLTQDEEEIAHPETIRH